MHTPKSTGSRDLAVHLPELLEGALAGTPGSRSHFRLLDLPTDLLECLALYFEGKEGVRVLTVSSAFHDVFARSVWRVLSRKAIDVAEPTRSQAYARYGRLVRKIDISVSPYEALDLHNWLELFPNTTVLRTSIYENMSIEQKQLTFDAISGFHGLRVAGLCLTDNQSPFDLEALAALLIARNKDHTKQPVRQIELWFSDDNHSEPWVAVHRFVDTVAVLSLESLRVNTSLWTGISPTPAQFAALCPYLVSLPHGGIYNDGILCFDEHNKRFFGMDGVSSTQPIFPLLTGVQLTVCCASSNVYNYGDITPVNFPQLQLLSVSVRACTNHADGNGDAALQKILGQHWPSVTEMGLHGALNSSAVDAAFLYNPQLTSISIDIGRGIAGEADVFLVERIPEQFPKLLCLSLKCTDNVKLDTQWTDGDNWESVRSSELQSLAIESATITTQILKLMTMLPKLAYAHFSNCAVDNESAAIAMLEQVLEDKTARNSDTDDGDVDGRYPCSVTSLNILKLGAEVPFWSCELISVFVAVMSQPMSITMFGYPSDIVDTIKERFPNIEVRN